MTARKENLIGETSIHYGISVFLIGSDMMQRRISPNRRILWRSDMIMIGVEGLHEEGIGVV